MDTNTATVVISGFTMITSIATAILAHYTNRRTKRIENGQKAITLAMSIKRLDDDAMQKKPIDRTHHTY